MKTLSIQLLSLLCTCHILTGATLNFTYFELHETTTFFGNPIQVPLEGEGVVVFDDGILTPSEADIMDFSLELMVPVLSPFGTLNLNSLSFGIEDVESFSATIINGDITSFELVVEDIFTPPNNVFGLPDEVFRFTVEDDLSAIVEMGEGGSATILAEGDVTIVPEPTSTSLIGLSLISFCLRRKRGQHA